MSPAMHLVLLNQYYPPDAAPTGVMLEAVVEELKAEGHQISVICSKGGYAQGDATRNAQDAKGRHDADNSIRIHRVGATRCGRRSFAGKILDYASYYLAVGWILAWMHPKPDRIVALTTPPYLSLLARALSWFRGADHAHWVMDLYPEVLVAHGLLRQGGIRHQMLSALTKWGFGGRRCGRVLTLGPDMAELLSQHLPNARRSCVTWVPLWGTEPPELRALAPPEEETSSDDVRELRRERGWADEDLVVMYSGNMGLGHRFSEILEMAKLHESIARSKAAGNVSGAGRTQTDVAGNQESIQTQDESTTRFVFFGNGKRRIEIEEHLRKNPSGLVELRDYAPREGLADHLRSADLHLVTLEPKWTGTMLPSKLQGIFAVSRPVIFIGDTRSSISRWVTQSGGGWVVAPGDLHGLNTAIREARDPNARILRGKAARIFAQQHFNRRENPRRAAGYLSEITQPAALKRSDHPGNPSDRA